MVEDVDLADRDERALLVFLEDVLLRVRVVDDDARLLVDLGVCLVEEEDLRDEGDLGCAALTCTTCFIVSLTGTPV